MAARAATHTDHRAVQVPADLAALRANAEAFRAAAARVQSEFRVAEANVRRLLGLGG